ncbi:hypothetical protein [Nostoc sp.]|uniref:hypothetical protein n=1 Tax=Nostoc sp. TaxID=1180 RepID=UPI002FF97F2C
MFLHPLRRNVPKRQLRALFSIADKQINRLEGKMDLFTNRKSSYLACVALLTVIVVAVLTKFDGIGIVAVQVTPDGIQVVVKNSHALCPIDQHLPEVQPKLPDQELAKYRILPIHNQV